MTTTPSHDDRAAGLLDGIRRTFAAKGFDGASMQDLALAAGMSVGNFYRYFPSKAAMVEAIVQRDLDGMEAEFDQILQAADPKAELRRLTLAHACGNVCDVDTALMAEIHAASLRKPEIAAVVARMEAHVEANLLRVFAHATGLPIEDARTAFTGHARFLIALVQSAGATRAAGQSSPADALFERAVDGVLDEVFSTTPSSFPSQPFAVKA